MTMMEENLQDVLDNVNVINNNFVVKHSTPKKHTSNTMKFAEELAALCDEGKIEHYEGVLLEDAVEKIKNL